MATTQAPTGSSSPGTKSSSSSSLLSSQSSPITFKPLEYESSNAKSNEKSNETSNENLPKHRKQSRSDDITHLYSTNKLALNRRHTEPMHRITNTKHNNYYSQIRFYRQNIDFIYYSQNRQVKDIQKPFPDNRIQNYIHFREKYRFIMQKSNRKLLGYGAMSAVYKVYLYSNRSKKFAAKISSYKDNKQKQQIMEENRLLHRFGAGLYIYDIYDDTLNKRLIFIQPYGKDMKQWWNNKENGVKYRFERENPKKQEWILKKILYEILLNLREIHNAGYIHHDIKPQNILVTKNTNYKHKTHDEYNDEYYDEWINKYNFHIIDYGLTVPCKIGKSISLDNGEIRFGTFGYNAWELMKTHMNRKYNHSIDLYALGITICELIFGQHILRRHNNFKKKQEDFCYKMLIDNYKQHEREENDQFYGFTEYDIYAQTLRLKCEYWRKHFKRRNGVSDYNGDESSIRSIVIKSLQYKTPYTTRFKNFISNIIRDNPKKRISTVDAAIGHDLFYNI
eukprot:452724_1